MKPTFRRFFSLDSAKAVKAQQFGWLNGINYMAPASSGGHGNLCSHASPACIAMCLGWHSGQAGMVKDADHDLNSVRLSRIAKVAMFMEDRQRFMAEAVAAIEALVKRAASIGFKPCARMNGATDIAWEGVRCTRNGVEFRNVFEAFPEVVFVDYTKNHFRMKRALPSNYFLTFSRSEKNEATALQLLSDGHNVAVVFSGNKPASWHGFDVVDGDEHDLRQLDPRASAEHPTGYVIALSPKGQRAKNDTTGFVVRS